MKLLSSTLLRAAAVAVALPLLGFSATVQVNGVCVNGSCTPVPVTYGPGNTQMGSTSNGLSVNSDSFSASSSFLVGTAAAGSTFIDFYPSVSYIGAAPSTSNDTITINLLASIYDASATNWDGTYNEHIPLLIATNSTGQGELFVDGQGVGLIGPHGAGFYNESMSADLTGVNGSTLDYAFDFTFTFAPGTLTGATDSSPAVPEPATMIPAALSLAGFALVAIRRRKQ